MGNKMTNLRLTPQLHESAGGLPSLKLSLHSCSLPGSTDAMGIETFIARVLPGREHECDTSFSTASSSGNNKKGAETTVEVSNSNLFDVLNSVDNDVEFGTNGGNTNSVNNEATSSGSFGQAILVDKAGNPLKKVEFPGEYDSEDEVASVEMNGRSKTYVKDLSHELQAICDNLDIRV
ncbi:hypothetical protein Tco_1194752 [Tanacetum coccineum]